MDGQGLLHRPVDVVLAGRLREVLLDRERPARNAEDWRGAAEETGEFVCNIVSTELAYAMNLTAKHVPIDVNELEMAGLTPEPSEKVKPPRVKEAPAHLECEYWKTIDLPTNNPKFKHGVVFGHVVGIHINDDIIVCLLYTSDAADE